MSKLTNKQRIVVLCHIWVYMHNPTPKQRYNSYKGEMNGTCKNLLLDKRERISILEKHILIETLKLSVNQKWTTDVSDFKTTI